MKRVIPKDIEELIPWRRDVHAIRKMREKIVAPVDTMGCHKLADPLAVPKVHRFQVLVALMLSSQTRDEANAAAMKRLKDHGLTIEDILTFKTDELEKILCPVSFYKTKAVHLQKTASILKETYDSDIPDSLKGLCSLPGVGPKMANLVLQIAWQKCEGIAVDTHVHRISNRLGWLKTKTPEQTRIALEKLLPREEWQPINHLLVGFGQMLCKPVHPKCSECLLRLTCPSSTNKKVETKIEEEIACSEMKVEVKVEVKEEDSEMKPAVKKPRKTTRIKK